MKRILQLKAIGSLFIILVALNSSFAQYTLTDADVEVTNGIIESCSYDFATKDIIIPNTLDGQTVTGIGENVFMQKEITALQLPSSLVSIGNSAFRDNSVSSISFLNFSDLKTIGEYAFEMNDLQNIILTGCTSLEYIGDYAFKYNSLDAVDLNECVNLIAIGEAAFYSNTLDTIDISANTKLRSIEKEAFRYNSNAIGFELPEITSLESYGWKDGAGNTYSAGDTVYNYEINYFVPAADTLTDNDVVVIDGVIDTTTYNFYIPEIAIPETLDGQKITGIKGTISMYDGIFSGKGITSVNFPSSIKFIGKHAFADNLIRELDFSNCNRLYLIEERAFAECDSLSGFNLPIVEGFENILWIDDQGNTYEGGDEVTDLEREYLLPYPYTLTNDDVYVNNGVLDSCVYSFEMKNIIIPDTLDNQLVTKIGESAFESKGLTSVILPAGIDSIANRAFYQNYENAEIDFSKCTNLTYIGDWAFSNNGLSDLDISACKALKKLGQQAFSNNYLSSIDLSALTSLIMIKGGVFNENNFTNMTLPAPDMYGYTFDHWSDQMANQFDAGSSVPLTTSYTARFIEFPVPFIVTDGTNPIENAKITIDSTDYFTDANGIDTAYYVPEGNIAYTISALGYNTFEGSVNIDGYLLNTDFSQEVILTVRNEFNVTFTVVDETTENPIEGANVSLTGYGEKTTDTSGIAQFDSVSPAEDIPFEVTADGYLDITDGLITVFNKDVFAQVSMTTIPIETYNVSFNVTDGTNPIEGAIIELEGYGMDTTDAFGQAIFAEILPATIAYTVSAENYFDIADSLSVVDEDETVDVTLLIDSYQEMEQAFIQIFPNPASTTIHILQKNSTSGVVELFSLDGKLLLIQEFENANEIIDISALQPQICILRYRNEQHSINYKLIIQ